MKKYQIILNAPQAPMTTYPQALISLLEVCGLIPDTFQKMVGTKVTGGRILIQGEAYKMRGDEGVALDIVCAGAHAKYGGNISLYAAQTAEKEPQYDANGDPVMVDSGGVDELGNPIMVHDHQVNVYKAISAATFAQALIPLWHTDQDGNPTTEYTVAEIEAGLLDGSIKPNKHQGAEHWVIEA